MDDRNMVLLPTPHPTNNRTVFGTPGSPSHRLKSEGTMKTIGGLQAIIPAIILRINHALHGHPLDQLTVMALISRWAMCKCGAYLQFITEEEAEAIKQANPNGNHTDVYSRGRQ